MTDDDLTSLSAETHPDLASVEQGIDVIARGGMIVLVDDKDRENEGDLVVAAEHCRPEDINFMCKYGRGLVCLALSAQRVADLRLPMMVPTDPGHMGTAFTVSIEAREGVTTGISAADRAQTVRVAADPTQLEDALVSPGHIFPLRAQPGGVLVRSGHTEGAVDLARLAGLTPAGVICEIMRDDGEMARMDDLEHFARVHELPILTIADLIEYRLGRETLVEEVDQGPIGLGFLGVSSASDWVLRSFRSKVDPSINYLALCKGDLRDGGLEAPVLLRAHRARVAGDVFGFGEPGARLRTAIQQIDRAGRGVFLYVVGRGEKAAEQAGLKPAEAGFREFGLGAQVLSKLGLKRITVITNNPRKIIGLRGYGIEVAGMIPLRDG